MTQPAAPARDLRLPPPTPWERVKGKVHALILIAVILAVFALSGLAYAHFFESSIPVTLHADRAGLQMHAGNRVKVNGIDLGRVTSVRPDEAQDGVDIGLALEPELAARVPTNATVSLEQLTTFGNKAVQFHLPDTPSGQFLAAGSQIEAGRVTVEINDTFDQLMTLLNRIQPSKLNTVLGGLANTFEGNGEALGATITQANAYLKKLNPDLAPLKRDLRSVGGFSEVYAGAGNSIADLLRNAGTTSATFGDKRAAFEVVLDRFGRAGDEIDSFFGANAEPLTRMFTSLRPTTSLLNEYAPMLTCFIDGAAVTYDALDAKLFNQTGANFEVNFVEPGNAEQYRYPRDLPENGPGREKGPNCRGLPVATDGEASLADYTTGPDSLNQRTEDNTPRLALTPGQLEPVGSPVPNPPTSLQSRWPAMTPAQKFFGPYDVAPVQAPVRKAGK